MAITKQRVCKTCGVGHKDGEDRECPICGKTYHVTPYHIAKGSKLVCSIKCFKESKSATYKCEQCGKEIKGLKSRVLRFCSRECLYKWQSEYNGKEKEIRICKWCGKEFEMWQLSGKGKKGEIQEGQFCSRKCRYAQMKSDNGWFEVDGIRGRKGDSCNVYPMRCAKCDKFFLARSKPELYCSVECKNVVHLKLLRNKYWKERDPLEPFECEECGKLIIPKYGNRGRKRFCSTSCADKYFKRIRGNTHKVRAIHFGCEYEPVDPLKVFARDGWRCQICHKKLRPCNRGTIKDNAPELDHIIPLSQGGEHSYRNTQCACRKCNSEKSNNIYGQLRMFG